MMIDYIKIEINDINLIEKIRENKYLVYDSKNEKYKKDTGEIYYIHHYHFKNLKFTITVNSKDKAQNLYIAGSLHKIYNNGQHNANDFTYYSFLEVVETLKLKFGIDPHSSIIRSLEYGINIIPHNYKTLEILQNTFYHSTKKFFEPIDKKYKQAGEAKKNEYIIKIYDKAKHYPQYTNGELLRFEVKYSRMRPLFKMRIVYLSDLLVIENHIKLQRIIKQRFSEILFYDFTIDPKKLTPKKQKTVLKYSNINYWENKLIDIDKGQKHRNNFTYHKNRLKTLVQNHSRNVQKKLMQTIDNKLVTLLPQSQKTVVKKEKYSANTHPIIKTKYSANTHLYRGWKCTIDTSLKTNKEIPKKKCYEKEKIKYEIINKTQSKSKQNQKKCLITGLDISMQKESELLSHTGLKYYYKVNRQLYEEVKNVYLTEKWANEDMQTQVREIAHNIRNRKNNQRLKQVRLYPKHQLQLFEI